MLYLGVPTGAATRPNTLFVVDLKNQRVWYYTYPFSMVSGFWDYDDSKLLIGTTQGNVMRVEEHNTDVDDGNVETPIGWSVVTRAWTWPDEARLTNLSIDSINPVRVDVVVN